MKNKILSLVLAVLCMVSIMPFTAIVASAADYGLRPIFAENISNFEDPWSQAGNYKVQGVIYGVDEFDGETVKSVKRDPDAEKITAYRAKDDSTTEGYNLNFFSYGKAYDSYGDPIRLYDAQYVSVEYYYDTTDRDASDPNGADHTGKNMRFDVNCFYNNGADTPVGWVSNSADTLVANQWDTIVIDIKSSAGDYQNYFEDPTPNYHFGQWKLYPFGDGTNIQMYKGDVLYIKSITFTSYDPTNPPSEPRTITVYADEDAWLNYDEPIFHEEVQDLYRYTLPEYPAESIPEGAKFINYYMPETDTYYSPGDVIVLDRGFDIELYGICSTGTEVTFRYGENSFTETWFAGETSKMPDIPGDAVIPDGQVFIGWSSGSETYKAGADYAFSGDVIEFTAVFGDPAVVYYSASGTIEGVSETVYTTLTDAVNAITEAGGIGVVMVSGRLEMQSTTISCSDLTIKGYDDTAVIGFGKDGTNTIKGSNTKITISDIEVSRSDSANDENWLALVNVDLTFADSCTYSSGTRTTNSSVIELYVGQEKSTGDGGFSLTVDAPIKTSQFATVGGYTGGGFSYKGEYNIEINNGTHSNVLLGSRNGNAAGAPSTIIGNVTATVNGGKITNFIAGSLKATHIKGNAIAVINGGEITNVKFGDNEQNNNKDVSNITNLALVVNAKEISEGGYAVPFAKEGIKVNTENAVVIYNNTEYLISAPSEISTADYNITAKYGKVMPVFSGNSVSFDITPDNAEMNQVLAGGVIIEPEANGLYTLDPGKTEITFAKADAEAFTVTYKDGDNEISGGSYYEGDEFKIISAFTKAGAILTGYTYNGETYNIGDMFTMPAENVVFEANWYSNEHNAYYVASNGYDSSTGSAGDPFATFEKAFAALDGNDGIIVVKDNVPSWPSFTIPNGQTVTVTGKDPYTGEIFEDATINRKDLRPPVSSGHLILEYIEDHNDNNANNVPFVVKTNLTIGTGYVFSCNGSSGNSYPGTQVETGSATSPTIVTDGAMQFITIADWGDATVSGDLNITVGPNATFSQDQGIALGGDAGSNINVAVAGKTFVTVNKNPTEFNIYRGGFKSTVNTTLNGLQIVLNETNAVVKTHSSGTYTNNGAEYIVRTPILPEGADVQSVEFGKVNVTIPAGYVINVQDSEGTTKYESSGIITLKEGETTIQFNSDSIVTVNYDDAESETYAGGYVFTFPGRDVVEDTVLLYWTVDGSDTKYFPGDKYNLPVEGGEISLTSHRIPVDSVIYYDQANGNDANDGISPETAVKTLDAAGKRLKAFVNGEATLHIVGTIYESSINFPAYDGVLTIEGDGSASSLIKTDNGFYINSDTIFKNISVSILVQYKHIGLNGYDLTFAEDVVKAEGSQKLTLHAGKGNANMTGDQKIVLQSGTLDQIQAGPYYISSGVTTTWDGNLSVVIDGASVSSFKLGDGYAGSDGRFTLNGSVDIQVKSGSLGTVYAVAGYCDSYDALIVHNYTNNAVVLEGYDERDAATYCFNYSGVTPVEFFADGVKVDKEACIDETGASTDADLKITYPEANGVYTIRAGESVASGLTIDGAQIRIATPEKKQGLRFIATLTDELAAQYTGCEYGYVVVPTVALDGALLEAGGSYTYNDKVIESAIVPAVLLYEDGDGYVRYTVCITDIAVENYKSSYSVVTYIKDGDTYIYGQRYAASVYDIAKAAIAAHEDGTIPLEEDVLAKMNEIIVAADAVE